MKRPLLVIVLGYIIGIVWGLYCKCSIALFYAIIIPSYVIAKKVTKSKRKFKIFSIKRYYRYIKIFLKSNTVLTIIVSSFISNCFVIYQNNKYYNLYSNLNKVDLVGVIISNIQEKEYKKVCIIKIQSINGQIKYKDTFLLLNIKKSDNTKIEYGDKINVRGFFKEPNQKRNYKGFDYKSYLKTKKIYGTVDTNKIEVINQKSINTIFLISNKCQIFIKNHIKKILPEE